MQRNENKYKCLNENGKGETLSKCYIWQDMLLSIGKDSILRFTDLKEEAEKEGALLNLKVFKEIVDVKVSKVALGKEHFLLLAADGRVFGFGMNSKGQLGAGKNVPLIQKISELEGLAKVGY